MKKQKKESKNSYLNLKTEGFSMAMIKSGIESNIPTISLVI